MIKHFKTVIILFLGNLILQSAGAQVNDIKDYISGRFTEYCDAVPREEVFVHTDRGDYIAGESIWFSVYLVNRQTNTISGSSSVVYFELLNQYERPVIQKRIRLEEGYGPGNVIIPDSVSSGTYTVRAYTNWMKNFLPENCFVKNIRIVNSLRDNSFIYKEYVDNTSGSNGNRVSLLEDETSDISMLVDNSGDETVNITVITNTVFRSGNGNSIYLFLQTCGIMNHLSEERVVGDTTVITVGRNELGQGINQLTLFDARGRPVCEKFFYRPFHEEKNLSVATPDTVGKRDKVSFKISLSDNRERDEEISDISISVVPVSDDPEVISLSDYMIFGSEFGLIPWSSIRDKRSGELVPQLIDSLLDNASSNWIDWQKILDDHNSGFKYMPEDQSHYISGRLYNNNGDIAGPGNFLFMSTPGKEAVFQYAVTDDEGSFNFDIPVDNHLNDLIIQPADPVSYNSIQIESSFSEVRTGSRAMVNDRILQGKSHIPEWSINYQIGRIYEIKSTGTPVNDYPDEYRPIRFYGKPDIEIVMDEYIKLPVMEEVFYELIPGVSMRKRNDVCEISVVDPIEERFFKVPPGLMVDGVIINDPSIIYYMDPEIIERIDIVKERYVVGDYLFYGIINVISETGDLGTVSLPDYAIRLPYRVTEPVRSFVSPDYSMQEIRNNRIPDFRNTLYWDADVITDPSDYAVIEFWSSDISADYKISVNGITSDGRLISGMNILRIE